MIGIHHEGCEIILWITADHQVLMKPRNYTFTGRRDWSHNPSSSFDKARELRRNSTPAERRLWQKLRSKQLGVKFRRQHPIGHHIVDFHCPERALVIELDGDSHLSPAAQEYDEQRSAYLQGSGLKVVRFTNYEVKRNLNRVIDEIQKFIGNTAHDFNEKAIWIEPAQLQKDDLIYFGADLQPAKIVELQNEETLETVYNLEAEGSHSFLTEVCAVHDCNPP